MADCPAGSAIKPGLEVLQWVLPEALCTAAMAIPGFGAWVSSACSVMAPQIVRIDDLCDSPPPEYPEINPVLLAEQGLLHTWSKNLDDWIWAAWVNANWAVLCQCNPVTSTVACTPVGPMQGSIAGQPNTTPVFVTRLPAGRNWTAANMRWTNLDVSGNNANIYARWTDASFNVLHSVTRTMAPGAVQTSAINASSFPGGSTANVRHLELWLGASTAFDHQAHAGRIAAESFTGPCIQDTTVTPPPPDPSDPGPPPVGPTPPPLPSGCTTDDLCGLLYQVIRQLQRTGQLVEVLQRWGVPFGYIPGTVHGPLSGSGQWNVTRLVAVRVDLQAPLPARQLEGTPPYVWDAGWMSIMTPDGMIEERRITRDTQIWQPRLMQEASIFGYYLKSGVSATFTELEATPTGPTFNSV